jgi:two-component system sensor histidine kinase MprB
MHILVVDDDPAVRSSLHRALRLEGYSVGLAGDGSEALAAVDADAPDVIVLDLMMPPPDGLEVCRRLRRAGNHTPILMLTAREAVGNRVDLSRRVQVTGRDELARLATDFNRLLAALEQSRLLQAQLVADASHELRTPLTSLRTNIEVLQRAEELDPADREALRRDALAQVDELTKLVADVVELARGEAPEAVREEIELADLVSTTVTRAEVHARAVGVNFDVDAAPSRVRGAPGRLERAVANLLDNAVKWSPTGGTVEVASTSGRVTVRDHGPGIPEADLPKVFDRFYRASTARAMPGSGLGLAIVREVVEAEGGTVRAGNHACGGAVVEIRLPAIG